MEQNKSNCRAGRLHLRIVDLINTLNLELIKQVENFTNGIKFRKSDKREEENIELDKKISTKYEEVFDVKIN